MNQDNYNYQLARMCGTIARADLQSVPISVTRIFGLSAGADLQSVPNFTVVCNDICAARKRDSNKA